MKGENKLRNWHLERKVCIYVRQSSQVQVEMHGESTRRQYDLRQRALDLGWQAEQISVVDEDLGKSAAQIGRVRSGYQRLVEAMAGGEVGAIMSVEISRLARQDSEGHKVVELAALMEALLIDEGQIYDPRQSDDRLLLGLKVLLSSNEIRQMHQRMAENRVRKAQRGELELKLPVGLVSEGRGKIGMDPNEAVRGAVCQVFEQFRLRGRQRDVLVYFNDNHLLFPRHRGNWKGRLEWAKLSVPRVRDILTNPLYAGGYVYGRTEFKISINGQGELSRKLCERPCEQWGVVRWGDFEGYISREEYEANQERLQPGRRKSRRSDGAALLSQIVLCGHCGQSMYTHYQGNRGAYVTYTCCADQLHYGTKVCQRVPGAAVDELVAKKVVAALSPAQIELSLAAMAELERQQTEIHQQWQRQLEGASYLARLAQRRYEQVEPENRLVARQLELNWERELQTVKQLEQDYHALCQKQPLRLSDEQRCKLLCLAQDFPRLWEAETTSWSDRKRLIKLLVADVTLKREADSIRVQIRWHTNQADTYDLPVPIIGGAKTPKPVVERLRSLYQTHTDPEIAAILNQEGLLTGYGNLFTRQIVADTRRRNNLRK
jgi:DNA invertase Pin-like site-specific DNA recombinase